LTGFVQLVDEPRIHKRPKVRHQLVELAVAVF
jgi:hypothetical protein